jgi:hypothetical protein
MDRHSFSYMAEELDGLNVSAYEQGSNRNRFHR